MSSMETVDYTGESSSSIRKVPVLSLKSYTQGSENDQLKFINELFYGIKDYGFIILKDHDVRPELGPGL